MVVVVVFVRAAEGRRDDELVVVVSGQGVAATDALQLGSHHLVEAHHDVQLLHRPLAELLDERVLRVRHRPPWAGVGVGVGGRRRHHGGSGDDDGGGGDGEEEEAAAAGVHGRRHGFYVLAVWLWSGNQFSRPEGT